MNSLSKKITALILTAVLLAGVLAGCKSATEPPDTSASPTAGSGDINHPATITIKHESGTTEVPFAPTRVFVLDIASLDTIDALGLGEYVVGVQEFRNVPSYLSKYYDSERIVVLPTAIQGHRDDEAVEAGYNSIDADLIIGGSRQVVDYDELSEIAPTIIMIGAQSSYDGSVSIPPLVEFTRSEATKIASIWGKTAEAEALLAEIETRAAALELAFSGKSGVFAAPNGTVGGLALSTDDNVFLIELGFENLSLTAPEDLGGILALVAESRASRGANRAATDDDDDDDDGYVRGEATPLDPEVVATALRTVTDWIEEQNPEYLIVINSTYANLDEAAAAGAEYPGVRDLTVFKNGGVYFLPATEITKGGLTFAKNQLSELEKIFS
jgi:iron complex transport system substrate-binding protein